MEFFSKIKIAFILIVCFFLLINFFGFSDYIKDFFYFISAPLQKVLWRGGEKVNKFFQPFFTTQGLQRENEICQAQRKKCLAELAFLEELEKENQALREVLNLGTAKEFKLLPVMVVGLDDKSSSLFIDKGKNDAVLENLPVITAQKVLVGKISKTSLHFSEVMLLSHPESLLPGELLQKGIAGLVRGKGNFNLAFEDLPKEKKITEGDIVVSKASLQNFPANLLIGKISELQISEIYPFQTAKILPFFKLNEISYLFVIMDF